MPTKKPPTLDERAERIDEALSDLADRLRDRKPGAELVKVEPVAPPPEAPHVEVHAENVTIEHAEHVHVHPPEPKAPSQDAIGAFLERYQPEPKPKPAAKAGPWDALAALAPKPDSPVARAYRWISDHRFAVGAAVGGAVLLEAVVRGADAHDEEPLPFGEPGEPITIEDGLRWIDKAASESEREERAEVVMQAFGVDAMSDTERAVLGTEIVQAESKLALEKQTAAIGVQVGDLQDAFGGVAEQAAVADERARVADRRARRAAAHASRNSERIADQAIASQHQNAAVLDAVNETAADAADDRRAARVERQQAQRRAERLEERIAERSARETRVVERTVVRGGDDGTAAALRDLAKLEPGDDE